jgi:hypothetical protein
MALRASSFSGISTKPKPRDSPEYLSLDDALDGVDPGGAEAGPGPDAAQGGRRDLAQLGPGLADDDLDVEPFLVAGV